ncbi:uncharacterized protein Z519_03421 [Cladophialophora bantiana CBS 173.52]|uniref:Peptidase S8/S53 domain-containing protein n=1 Tax=Cladophialophora bantiana (strain ATCC 10958 / CBS 173.52 / CDC B-1940 / NIH 8579) TaxID=1442370 RepID=A0A0D2GD62_CLAB1|nr:uncharacterized protein Z519_03421 [Cladophialophora bantiana CBS 173.52]KIW96352.1 hypothetical protein Z519_03421 [Cladophialophora bantiana CBS 173.52]
MASIRQTETWHRRLSLGDLSPGPDPGIVPCCPGPWLRMRMEHKWRAIEWAIDQKVDIIISRVVRFFNVDDELDSPLVHAIKWAVQQNILIFSSTADVGAESGHNFWPVNPSNMIAVSASDELGHPLLRSDHDVHAAFEGEKIQVEGPKYINKKSELALPSYASGSSVSTALAAGLGSLCLFLARMANESDRQAERFCGRSRLDLSQTLAGSFMARILVQSGWISLNSLT